MRQREELLASWQRDHSSLRYIQAQKGQGFPQEERILLSLGRVRCLRRSANQTLMTYWRVTPSREAS